MKIVLRKKEDKDWFLREMQSRGIEDVLSDDLKALLYSIFPEVSFTLDVAESSDIHDVYIQQVIHIKTQKGKRVNVALEVYKDNDTLELCINRDTLHVFKTIYFAIRQYNEQLEELLNKSAMKEEDLIELLNNNSAEQVKILLSMYQELKDELKPDLNFTTFARVLKRE